MNEKWRAAAADKDFRITVVFDVQQANDIIGASTLRFFESEVLALTLDPNPEVAKWARHTISNLDDAKDAFEYMLSEIREGENGGNQNT